MALVTRHSCDVCKFEQAKMHPWQGTRVADGGPEQRQVEVCSTSCMLRWMLDHDSNSPLDALAVQALAGLWHTYGNADPDALTQQAQALRENLRDLVADTDPWAAAMMADEEGGEEE